jgi:hypothetical protein
VKPLIEALDPLTASLDDEVPASCGPRKLFAVSDEHVALTHGVVTCVEFMFLQAQPC